MTPEQQAQMNAHVRAIAQLLHSDAKAEGLPMATLGEIEQTARHQLQLHVSPGIGRFLSKQTIQSHASRRDE